MEGGERGVIQKILDDIQELILCILIVAIGLFL